MDSLTKKTFKVSRAFEYTYYITPPAQPNGITVLCLHGFPDEASEWADLANSHLIPAGYGVLAVDCLGYSGTSKPTDPADYSLELMSKDLADILDHESLPKILVIGHDWGCALAQRLYNFHPDRVLGLAMVNVTYSAPSSQGFDLDAVNQMTEKAFGMPCFAYWHLTTAEDGHKLIEDHLESFFTACHGPPESWVETLCKYDGLKDYLLADKKQPVEPYATEEKKNNFIAQFERGGFAAPLCWYRAMRDEVNKGEDKKASAVVVEVPSLYVGFDKDLVCRPVGNDRAVQAGLLPKLTTRILAGGHWGLHSNAEAFGKTVVDWLKKEF